MALKWKDKDKIFEPALSAVIPEEELMSKTLGEVIEEHPRKYVERVERWCVMKNAETVGSKIKITDKAEKPFVKVVENTLRMNPDSKAIPFDIKTLKNWMGINNLSDGSLQRKALNVLTCLGKVKKVGIEYKDKKGNKKVKFKYVYKEDNLTPCIFLKKGRCTFDWSNKSHKTKYFEGVQDD